MAKGTLRVNGVLIAEDTHELLLDSTDGTSNAGDNVLDEDGFEILLESSSTASIQASAGDNVVIREDDGTAVLVVDTNGKTTITGSGDLEVRAGAATPGKLLLTTDERTVVDGNKLGQIDFQAPFESAGTDAILVGASIHAEADATFAADNNSTDLVFATGASEAAAEKLRITSGGNVGIGLAPSSTVGDGDTLKGLSIGGNTANGEFSYLQLLNRVENATTSNYIHVDFDHKVSGTTTIPLARISARPLSSTAGELSFSTSTSSSLSTAMIMNGGNVGIGATSLTGGNVKLDLGSTGSGVGTQIRFANDHNTTFYVGQAGDTTGNVILYNGGDTNILISTNGSERMRISNAGNVGIGTNDPGHLLHVEQTATSGMGLLVTRNLASGSTDNVLAKIHQNHATDDQTALHVRQDSPGYAIHVECNTNTTNCGNGIAIATQDENTTSFPLYIGTNTTSVEAGNPRFVVRADGNVGIGTSAPETDLHVGSTATGSIGATGRPLIVASTLATVYDGTSSATWQGLKTSNSDGTSNRTATGISFEHRTSSSGIAAIVSTSAAADRADIRFITRGSSGIGERMRIADAGYVGIGDVTPLSSLHVKRNATECWIRTENDAEYFQFGTVELGGIDQFVINSGQAGANRFILSSAGNLTISGSLSKGSGSFKIDHPLESKSNSHNLVHSFMEGPQADLIYRGKVTLVDGEAIVNIDTVSNMTEGTFVALNTNTQCFTTNETGWDLVKGSLSGNTLTITSQDNTSTDTISWMVVGERHDQHMIDTDWTDSNGKVIVERLKTEWQ